MGTRIKLHPVTPHARRIFELVDALRAGQILLFPTDTQYALGCVFNNKKGLDRIRTIRRLAPDHTFTLLTDSMTGLARFAHISDANYKYIKRLIPGPYTFILPATKDVPSLLLAKRKTIGFRVPESPICQRLIDQLGEPLLAVTAQAIGSDGAMLDRELLIEALRNQVDVIVDNEQPGTPEQTTVIDLTGEEPRILREGAGPV
jgi:tRNA threonylcarbamoyl adenosine modification protein (Sua5/YciO/YrdC/YwlC family)